MFPLPPLTPPHELPPEPGAATPSPTLIPAPTRAVEPPRPSVASAPQRPYTPPAEPWEDAVTQTDEADATPAPYAASGPRPLVVGIAGLAGSGKTTIAKTIEERARDRGVVVARISFAGPLKSYATDIFGFDRWYTETQGGKAARPLPGRDATTREILVKLGEACRSVDPDVWLMHAGRALREAAQRGAALVIVDDVRRPNEAAWIRRQGGVVIKLTRGRPPSWLERLGAPETERPWRLPGRSVPNDGTPAETAAEIERIAAEPFWGRP